MTSAYSLVDQLRAAETLSEPWAAAFAAVPRGRFIADRIWVNEADGDDADYVPIDRAAEPERWHAAVHANRVIVTQFDDGATPPYGRRPATDPPVLRRCPRPCSTRWNRRIGLDSPTGTVR